METCIVMNLVVEQIRPRIPWSRTRNEGSICNEARIEVAGEVMEGGTLVMCMVGRGLSKSWRSWHGSHHGPVGRNKHVWRTLTPVGVGPIGSSSHVSLGRILISMAGMDGKAPKSMSQSMAVDILAIGSRMMSVALGVLVVAIGLALDRGGITGVNLSVHSGKFNTLGSN